VLTDKPMNRVDAYRMVRRPVRSFTGDYLVAFMTSGLACLLASLLVLRVTCPAPAIVPAV
jgi:hypothetical protein